MSDEKKWFKVEYELAGRTERITVGADGKWDARRKAVKLLGIEIVVFRVTRV